MSITAYKVEAVGHDRKPSVTTEPARTSVM